MRGRSPFRVALPTAALVLAAVSAPAATLPAGFQEIAVITGRVQPTAIRFAPDGTVFVAEKSGLIWAYAGVDDTNPVLVVDLREQVHNFWDRGLLGLAVSPGWPSDPRLYVLYAHDVFPDGTGPRWGTGGLDPSTSDPCPSPPGATADGCVVFGRLSRIEVNPPTMTGTEVPLLHSNWCQQYPSHSTGDLVFGEDGYLYASAGDGASFNFADWGQDGDPVNPCDDPPDGIGGPNGGSNAEGGALRSQDILTTTDPTGLNGTLLRMDVGGALPVAPLDNPLVGNGIADDDFIVAIGLRNPFRINKRPGTGEIWIADVGWGTWEELNRVADPTGLVKNFGWPCYEGDNSGNATQGSYQGRDLCQVVYADAFPGGTEKVPAHYAYRHNEQVVPGELCGTGSSSVTGVAFNTGTSYPVEYDDALFFADSSRKCVWTMFADAGGEPDKNARAPLVSQATGRVVDIQMGLDDSLYYVDFDGGAVFRIEHFVGNEPPTAVIGAQPTNGVAPLLVQFDATGSSDPEDGTNLVYSWDLDDDGQFDDAGTINPTFVYTQAGTHTARVRVADTQGDFDTASIAITADNTPPTAVITGPPPGLQWIVGEMITFSGAATDPQDGPLPASQLSWDLILHHCITAEDCHTHPITSPQGVATASFDAPDHNYPSFVEIKLTALDLDPSPLSHTTSLEIFPQSVTMTFDSVPQGLELAVGPDTAVTPFALTLIVGSNNSVNAISPQPLGVSIYSFDSWSDGGAESHNFAAAAAGSTLIATFDPGAGCQLANPPGCDDGDVCNGVETCDPVAGCQPGTPLVCDDLDVCNGLETCGPVGGCQGGTPLTCNDGNVCNGTETCDAFGGCQPGIPLTCNDGDVCNGIETCDATDGCQNGTPLSCDDGELCTDDTCNPAMGCVHANNASPCDDTNACTNDDVCTDGICSGEVPLECDDGNPCTQDSCSEQTGCINEGRPAESCLDPGSAVLVISNKDDDDRDRLKWLWKRGPELVREDLGDPIATTTYALCIYDRDGQATALASSLIVSPNATWQDQEARGVKYLDRILSVAGVRQIQIKPGPSGKSSAQLKARGSDLPMPVPALAEGLFHGDPHVTVQLVNTDGTCWTSDFSAPTKNTATAYKAKAR